MQNTMKKLDENVIEKCFIKFLLDTDREIAKNELWIQPKHLLYSNYQVMLFAIHKSIKICNTINPVVLLDLFQKSKNGDKLFDLFIDIIEDDYLSDIVIPEEFRVAQEIIFDRYRNRELSKFLEQLSKGEIDVETYKNLVLNIENDRPASLTPAVTVSMINEKINNSSSAISFNNFAKLSNTLKLVQGDLLLVGAKTGTGKSGLLLNFMNDLMDRYQCVYFNMEMSESTIFKRMVSIKSNVPIYDIEHPKTDYQSNLIESAKLEIEKSEVIIENRATDLEEIKKIISKNKGKRHTIVFLDHIGLVRCNIGKNIYEQTTEVAKSLRQMCLEYNCTIIAACQLNRTSYTSNDLDISMLKDSGELENSSSKIILLQRAEKKTDQKVFKEKMLLNIVKNRDGMLDKIYCNYDKTKQVFEEIQDNLYSKQYDILPSSSEHEIIVSEEDLPF